MSDFPMTPDEARAELEIIAHPDDPRRFFGQAIRALETLASDTLKYRVEHQHIENGSWHPVTQWSSEWPLNEGHTVASDERIVCRRVSEPWRPPMSEPKWAVMSTMIGGWGVARPEHAYRENDGLLACTEWESLHDTWEEAMQEADRQASTARRKA